ncbi:hypothetical protein HF086_014689 [Spodoptera exigua]|uniref:Aminoacylase-1-like n=1 Tax=Spodoptera exigua TaxID=7107 RepID=A0A922M803_SPOEX|nr:hypothetical protein HF086_014689 [Spodoptera exigua]
MKSVAVQYIEAVKKLKANGIRLKRTLHLSFVPALRKRDYSVFTDEEIGGGPGMGKFVQTEAFKNLNVGFALDEGMASATDEYLIYNGERTIWHMKIICPGKSGHGSLLLPDNSGEKVRIKIKLTFIWFYLAVYF